MLLSLLTSTDITSWNLSDTCWNSTDNSLVSKQILILQILFLCLFSFHNLFSSPTATQSCYSGLYVAKEWHGRWDCSIFNAFGEKKAARACRVYVWSSSSLSNQTLRNVGGWCPKNESHTDKTVQRAMLLVQENSLFPCEFMKHSMQYFVNQRFGSEGCGRSEEKAREKRYNRLPVSPMLEYNTVDGHMRYIN